jgi:hypothetical protein
MDLERTSNHHAALTRNLPLRPLNDASDFTRHAPFTRHDPMWLPDVHLRRAEEAIGAVGRERIPSNEQTTPAFHPYGLVGARKYQKARTRQIIQQGQHAQQQHDQQQIAAMRQRPQYLETYWKRPHEQPSPQATQPEGDMNTIAPQQMRQQANQQTQQQAMQQAKLHFQNQAQQARQHALQPPPTTPHESSQPMQRYPIKKTDGPRLKVLGSSERLRLVCETVSRDETAAENVKNTSKVQFAMEPHMRNVRVSKD